MRFALIILLIFCLFCSAVLSSSETAFFSLSSMRILSYRHSPDRKKQVVANLLLRPRDLLVTLLMFNVLANILIQNIVSALFGTFSGYLLTVGLPLLLTLIFGEVIPKSIAYPMNEEIACTMGSVIGFMQRAVKPLRLIVIRITGAIAYLFSLLFRKERDISVAGLGHARATSENRGTVAARAAPLLPGHPHLAEDPVREVMCPRGEILFFDINTPPDRLLSLFVRRERGRVPVCSGTLENVMGIMEADRFFLHGNRIRRSQDVVPFLSKALFVPESMTCSSALRTLSGKGGGMLIVIDEYGSVAGLVTHEDIYERVIGKIADRRDPAGTYTKLSEDAIVANGKMTLEEFERLFDVRLESPNTMTTVGGWLTERFGDIPETGARDRYAGFSFHILASDRKRVRRVYVRRVGKV
ncbi:MAG: hemolysin family protein [Simkaniaceae bacterium]|nr:hemolysin family protein [Simkaniaceae bacterium]